MIRIFFNPLDAKSKVEYPVTEGTQLIHFLQEHYPNGFDGMLRVFVGIDELDLADLDYEVQKHDQITMLVMPSGVTWVAVGKILVTALVTAAVSYAINLIFAPKTPSFGDDADESPVYSLNPTRNSARLGQPISVSYGRVSWPPAFAAAPYGFYFEGSNDQYIDELLCLGHGKFNIHEVYIGDTPLSALESGTVRYWVFDQDVHQQQMGRVGDYITQSLENTDNNFPFYENVFTSPEVEGQEFYENKNEPNTTPAAISGNAYAGSVDPVTGFYIQGRIEDVDNSVGIAGGDTITLAGTASNNGTFVVKSVTQTEPGFMTIFESASLETPFIVDEQPLSGTFTIPSTVDGMTFGPYRCQKVGTKVTRVDCDIVFPQGLYYIDSSSGKTKAQSVEMEFTYQQIDEETGAPIGLPIVQTKEWTAATRVALRATVTSGELEEGAYECTVRRVNPVDDGGQATDLVTWAGLKGYVTFDRNKRAYGPVSLIAFRLKATNGIAAAARSRIRVVATRLIDGIESNNPISVIKDIWTNTEYGLGFPAAQLDPNLDSLETFWADPLGPKFNGSFDQKSTGYDGMQTVASFAGAKAVNNGQLLDVVPDGLQDVRSALFTTANIVRDSLEIFYTFDALGEFTGNVLEYRDPETFDSKYVYAPRQTDNPEAFTLFGCTDKDYAQRMANYLWNVKANRRKAIRFDTELEGLIPRFGQRIGVSHTMPDWGQSGVFVQQIDAVTWMVDQPLDWTENNVIIIRSDTGLPSSPYTVTKGAGDNIVVFGEVPPIHDQQGLDPTSYAFGTAENNIIDAIVTKILPKGENIVTIESQVYDEAVYVDAPWQMNPYDGPELCATYETALTNSSAVSIWTFNNGDGSVYPTGVAIPAIRSPADLVPTVDYDGSQVAAYPNPCPDAYSLSKNNETGQATCVGLKRDPFTFTMSCVITERPGGSPALSDTIMYKRGAQSSPLFGVSFPYGNQTDLRVQVEDFGIGVTAFRYNGIRSVSDKTAITVSIDNDDLICEIKVWVNWVLIATETRAKVTYFGDGNAEYTAFFLNGSSGSMNYGVFWDYALKETDDDVANLKAAWDTQVAG